MEDLLPFELWLEILSYIPRKHHRKLIGINRALYEYALDVIYQKIELSHDDESTLFTFTRLQNLNIAHRVQHLVVKPSFLYYEAPAVLPDPTSATDTESRTTPRKEFSLFHNSRRSGVVTTHHLHSEPQTSTDILLNTARRSIQHCTNIKELDIILNDNHFTMLVSLETFFQSLWQPGSILQRIRNLAITASSSALSQLILPSKFPSNFDANINSLDLTINPNRDLLSLQNSSLPSFLDRLKDNLTSLTLSGLMDPHIMHVLEVCPKFPRLSFFNSYISFNVQRTKQLEYLNRFLDAQSPTLQKMVLSPKPRVGTLNMGNYAYFRWLTLNGTGDERDLSFSGRTLSQLTSMELLHYDRWINGPAYHEVVFPDLSLIAPRLTALTIGQADLSFERVSELLALLPRHDGAYLLESLSISIEILSPELVDLLSTALSGLSSLTLRLSQYVLPSDLQQNADIPRGNYVIYA
ncbi:hypothetical protein JR316_0012391 [Psilocybe cubensis]|uniref:F-box domain-containing protein n=2 Tax=Psilocybe cubensis TaxID=181762 RepID=A0A8H8CG96_PSICU|nr:hypothetical protein JR316_0012391 [Psilocybe cubensis]KAH9475280.1 hypothetical protein JR316_0012391 [Psilocybe cubensis]